MAQQNNSLLQSGRQAPESGYSRLETALNAVKEHSGELGQSSGIHTTNSRDGRKGHPRQGMLCAYTLQLLLTILPQQGASLILTQRQPAPAGDVRTGTGSLRGSLLQLRLKAVLASGPARSPLRQSNTGLWRRDRAAARRGHRPRRRCRVWANPWPSTPRTSRPTPSPPPSIAILRRKGPL